MKIFASLLLIVLLSPVFALDPCKRIEDIFNQKIPLNFYEGALDNDLSIYGRTRVQGEKMSEIVKFAEKLNTTIVDRNSDKFVALSSKKNFWRFDEYSEGSKIMEITTLFHSQLNTKRGPIYDFLFGENKDPDKIMLRDYLLCMSKKMKWDVLYNKKKGQYEVWFAIPNGLIQKFGFFHYVIQEENDKLVLVGF